MISVKANYFNRSSPSVGASEPVVSLVNGIEVLDFKTGYSSSSVGVRVSADLRPAVLVVHPERLIQNSSFGFTTEDDVFRMKEYTQNLSDDVFTKQVKQD